MIEDPGDHDIDDADYDRWREMLFGTVDQVADRLIEEINESVPDDFPGHVPVDRERMVAKLTTLVDEQEDKFCRLAVGTGVLAPSAADCAEWVDAYHLGRMEDAEAARADEQLEERRGQ